MKSKDVKFDDEVQKALALKRHEAPPARFFNAFSHEVLDRINSPEPEGPPTWKDRLGLGDDLKPVLLCGVGIFACTILFFCLVLALRVDKPEQPLNAEMQGADPSALGVGLLETSNGSTALPGFQTLGGSGGSTSSIAPVMVSDPNETHFSPKP